MILENIIYFLFIIFNLVIVVSFLLSPLFYVIAQIFYHGRGVTYLRINNIFLLYFTPLAIFFFFFPSLFLINDSILQLVLFILSFLIYQLPLLYLLNFFIFKEKVIVKILAIFLLLVSIELTLYYILYNIIN
ncbi:hypothetical protein HAV_01198 [Candidatus Hepatincola sp. Av]